MDWNSPSHTGMNPNPYPSSPYPSSFSNYPSSPYPATSFPDSSFPGSPAEGVSATGILTSDFTKQVVESVAAEALESGRQKAKSVWDLYARLDYIRPYFDTEPKDVLERLGRSLLPLKTSALISPAPDLYGGTMNAFTLATILFWGLQLSDASVASGSTRLGSALAVTFTYWALTSALYYFFKFIFDINLTLLQIVAITGYSLFGLWVALLIHCFIQGIYDLLVLFAFGGLSGLSMAVLLFHHTPVKRNGTILAVASFIIHILFLSYIAIYYANLNSPNEIPVLKVDMHPENQKELPVQEKPAQAPKKIPAVDKGGKDVFGTGHLSIGNKEKDKDADKAEKHKDIQQDDYNENGIANEAIKKKNTKTPEKEPEKVVVKP